MPATFLERVAMFDFDKYYTPKIRALCHISMWLFFSLCISANLLFGYGLDILGTILFVLRSLICNTIVFYFFFYFVVPNTLFKNKVGITLVFVPFVVILWLLINHYCFVAIHRITSMNVASVEKSVSFGAKQTIIDVLSLDYLSAEFMMVVYSVSPFLSQKYYLTLFDSIRLYSKRSKRQTNWRLKNSTLKLIS